MSKFDWSKNFCSDWLLKKLMGYSPTALTGPGKRQPIGWNTARKRFPGLAHVAGALAGRRFSGVPPRLTRATGFYRNGHWALLFVVVVVKYEDRPPEFLLSSFLLPQDPQIV